MAKKKIRSKSHVQEVETRLRKFRRTVTNVPDVYKTKLEVWWLKSAEQSQEAKKGYRFSQLPHAEQVVIWREVWSKSNVLEVMNQSLIYYRARRESRDLIKDWPALRRMIDRVENWAHSDSLSDLYARLLEKHPKKITPTLIKWNRSKNPWKRRQSVVSLFYYQALRHTFPPAALVFRLLTPLIPDPHYYVQKGVGWTLREAIQVYPKETRKFLNKNVLKLSSVAFTTVMEKADLAYKTKLKAMRKAARTKGSTSADVG